MNVFKNEGSVWERVRRKSGVVGLWQNPAWVWRCDDPMYPRANLRLFNFYQCRRRPWHSLQPIQPHLRYRQSLLINLNISQRNTPLLHLSRARRAPSHPHPRKRRPGRKSRNEVANALLGQSVVAWTSSKMVMIRQYSRSLWNQICYRTPRNGHGCR